MRFNQLQGAGARFTKQLIKTGGLEEQEGLPTVAPELMPAVVLENDRPEQLILGGYWPFMDFRQDAAVAAQTSHVGVINPANSGRIVVIKGICVFAGGANMNYQIGHRALDFTPDATTRLRSRDTRRTAQLPESMFDLTAASIAQIFLAINVLANASVIIEDLNFILGPSRAFIVNASAVNTAASLSVWGYARVADPAELEIR